MDGTNPVPEYVPFYFAWLTAVQREVEFRSITASNELVFADVSVAKISELSFLIK